MFKRNLLPLLRKAMTDTPVVLLTGARQTGKTTLVQQLLAETPSSRYVSLDDLATLEAARSDPKGFLGGLGDSTIALDEVQLAPQLFPAIKQAVDRRRAPGRFLLTGSANVLLLPRLSESLAGRMDIFTLHPFSQGELVGAREGFVDALFARRFPGLPRGRAEGKMIELLRRMADGGYPEVQTRTDDDRKQAWFKAYVTTILQRDVREIANIEGLTQMPRLLSLLAARAGSLLNSAEISRSLQMPQTSLKRYMSLFEMTFLVRLLPAWSGNLGKRLVKAPTVFFGDTGLAAHLSGFDVKRASEGRGAGPLLENFVFAELLKQTAWSSTRTGLFHFRAATGQEVDLVLESADGRVAGIEVKTGASVRAEDFRGLRFLKQQLGRRFVRGVALYAGSESVPFGDGLFALPIQTLWELGARPAGNR